MAQAQVWQLGDMEVGRVHGLELRQDGGKLYADGPVVILRGTWRVSAADSQNSSSRARWRSRTSFLPTGSTSGRYCWQPRTAACKSSGRADGVYASVPLPDTTDGARYRHHDSAGHPCRILGRVQGA